MSNKALFKFEHGAIIRGKKTLFSVDEFKFGAGEWLTITGKMVQVNFIIRIHATINQI